VEVGVDELLAAGGVLDLDHVVENPEADSTLAQLKPILLLFSIRDVAVVVLPVALLVDKEPCELVGVVLGAQGVDHGLAVGVQHGLGAVDAVLLGPDEGVVPHSVENGNLRPLTGRGKQEDAPRPLILDQPVEDRGLQAVHDGAFLVPIRRVSDVARDTLGEGEMHRLVAELEAEVRGVAGTGVGGCGAQEDNRKKGECNQLSITHFNTSMVLNNDRPKLTPSKSHT